VGQPRAAPQAASPWANLSRPFRPKKKRHSNTRLNERKKHPL
jgi:hypothetical protein